MTQTGSVYAEALYDLALEEGLCDQALEELEALDQGFATEPDFLRLLASPALSKQERCQILDESFRGRVQPYILNTLKLLTQKGYIRRFHGCVASFRARYYREHGIVPVEAVTAVPLTDDQKQRLTEKLAAITGKQILLRDRVDPSCLGGVRLNFDGKQLDDTVAHRLEAIRAKLTNTVL